MNTLNKIVMTHIYSKNIMFSVYYTYDDKHKKVYDLKTMQLDFKEWIKKIKAK